MKKIGILLPCYNEEKNIHPMVDAIVNLFESNLKNYEYEIVFIDNHSTDKTVQELEIVCKENSHVKAILNEGNYMWSSTYYGITQTSGDCVICIPSDFQVPVSNILELVSEWEKGEKIVCLIKNKSDEKKGMWRIRQLYNKLMVALSEGETLPNFSGGLYDREFIEMCKKTKDPLMYLSFRSFICSSGYKIKKLYYHQNVRKNGKSSNNFKKLFEISVVRFTESSKLVPKLSILIGGILESTACIALIIVIISAILHNLLLCSIAFVSCIILIVGGIQLILLGLLGEYLMKINDRLKNWPMVIEKSRINF